MFGRRWRPRGRAAHIPLIIGTNGGEGSLLGADAHTAGLFPQLSPEDLRRLAELYGAQASDDGALARLVFRDGYVASRARWIASKASATGTPTYLYRFCLCVECLQGRRAGAYHGSEVPFVFDRLPPVQVDDTDTRVERALHECWVACAKTGNPPASKRPIGRGSIPALGAGGWYPMRTRTRGRWKRPQLWICCSAGWRWDCRSPQAPVRRSETGRHACNARFGRFQARAVKLLALLPGWNRHVT
jgi:hypothetical protein